jgi:hypothetical protein
VIDKMLNVLGLLLPVSLALLTNGVICASGYYSFKAARLRKPGVGFFQALNMLKKTPFMPAMRGGICARRCII